jgi:hypothetical protein
MTLTERRCLLGAILGTLFLQLLLTGFFSFGKSVPLTIDTHAGNYQQTAFHFPPRGDFNTDYWLGLPQLPNGLHPLSLYAHLPFWIFATSFYPLCAALSVYFTFLLFQLWGFRPFASIFAGILFAWQGSFLSNLLPAHFSPAALFCLFPLTFFGAVQAQRRRSPIYWCWTGVGSGMMLLFLPDQGFLANLLIGIYLVFSSISPTPPPSPSNESPSGIRSFFFGVIVWAFITALIALPGIEGVVIQNINGVRQGASESPEKKFDWATQWSFTPEEITQYIVPGFLGWHNLSQEGPYWGRIGQSSDWNAKDQGMRNYMLGINTLGTVAALLAFMGLASLAALFKRDHSPSSPPHRIVYFFLVATAICWVLGLGKYTPFYHLFYAIPGMDTWRNPLKFILLPGNFSLLFISTFGAVKLFEVFQLKEKEAPFLGYFRRLATVLSLALLFLIPLYLILTVLLPAILPMFQYSPAESGHIVGTLLGSILVALIITGLWRGLFTLMEKSSEVRHFPLLNPWIARLRDKLFIDANLEATWFMGLCLLVVMQLMWVHHHYLFQRPPPTSMQTSDFIEQLKKSPGPVRVKLMSRDTILDEHLNIRFPLHHISSIDIPAASRVPMDYQVYFEKMGSHLLRLSEISAVQYLIGNTSDWAQYKQDPNLKDGLGETRFFGPGENEENPLKEMPDAHGSLYAVSELKNALPRISMIPACEVISNEELLFQRLQDPRWNPKHSILLQTPPATSFESSTPAGSLQSLKVITYNSHEIRVTTEIIEPTFLLIADRFDPDWKAEINQKPVEILRANFIQRAILLPPGKSTVVLTYSPSTLPVYIQLLTLLSLTLVSVRVIRSAHRCASIPHN